MLLEGSAAFNMSDSSRCNIVHTALHVPCMHALRHHLTENLAFTAAWHYAQELEGGCKAQGPAGKGKCCT